jgi:hypothetical protein
MQAVARSKRSALKCSPGNKKKKKKKKKKSRNKREGPGTKCRRIPALPCAMVDNEMLLRDRRISGMKGLIFHADPRGKE